MADTATKMKYSVTDYSSVADFSSPEKYPVMQRDMKRTSLFQELFDDSGVCVLKYDAKKYPFADAVSEMLVEKGIARPGSVDGAEALMMLHEQLSKDDIRLDASGINEVTRKCYERSERYNTIYEEFVREVCIGEWLKEEGIYQAVPTMRFYFPNAEGFDWKLNYHTDIMLGHPPQEINIWVPLTRVYDTNSIRIVNLQDSLDVMGRYGFDFKQCAAAVQDDSSLQKELFEKSFVVEAQPGEAILFDSRCLHVLQNNVTPHTRISLDLRIMPKREYDALEFTYIGTGRRQMPFTIGEYYSDNVIKAV